jgi:hypothetical protein
VPALALRVASGHGAPTLRQVVLALPRGLSLGGSRSTVDAVARGGTRVLIARGRVTVTLRRGAPTLRVTLGRGALRASPALVAAARAHRGGRLRLAITVTAEGGLRATLASPVRPRS